AQVERSPDAVALVFQHSQLTYKQLNQRANQLAHYLRARGVGPDMLVGICIERSIEMIIAILGVLKAGAAYIPLDPAYPPERLAFILEDAVAPVLITRQHLRTHMNSGSARVVCVDADGEAIAQQKPTNPGVAMDDRNLAYAIY